MNSRKTLTIAAATCMIFSARADIFDNFDSYANTAALTAVWNQGVAGTGLQLAQASPTPVSAPNEVKQATTAASRMARSLGTGVQANKLDWTFSFFDGSGSRDFCNLYAYTGAYGSGLQTALAMGVYNTGVGGKYMARYSAITGATYADGATATAADSGTGGWFSLTGAANRSSAWHTMRVLGKNDPVNSGKLKLEFWVDGVLGGSIANINSYNLTYAQIGGNVSTTAAGSAVDNFSVVTIVPEPSSMALALLGGFGLLIVRMRRQ